MSWRFRKTFKVLPGIRLNLTSRGISATVGVAPFSINVGPRGVYSNVGIPGTGIWDRQRLDRQASVPSPPNLPGSAPGAAPLPSFAPPAFLGPDVTEIRSASTEMLKSQSMADLQRLLEEAFEERKELEREVSAAQREAEYATSRYCKWETGLLFKRIFHDAYAMRKDAHETATAKFQELTEQLRLTVLATQIDIEREQAEPYYRMRDDFAKLCESQKIWDTLDRRDINRVVTRSAASEAITREPVSFALGCCDIIQWDQKPLHLPNRTGGDLFLYPGFALYRAAKKAFAIIDSREIQLHYTATRFIEDGAVPTDAQVVGKAWAKSNRDGSPDRRFRDNYQMPIVLYGQLRFTSPTGLNEEFQVSNAAAAERFAKSWGIFQASFAASSSSPRASAPLLPPKPQIEELDPATAFSKESDTARKLVSEQGDYWEFLLTEELLRTKLQALEADYANFDQLLISAPKKQIAGREFIRWVGEKLGELSPLVHQMSRCFEEEMPASWGKPGEAGDPIQILRTANALVGYARAYMSWELEVCSTQPPATLRHLRDSLRGVTGSLINDLKGATDQLGRAISDVRNGSTQFRVNFEFSSPPQLNKLTAEMEKVTKRPEWANG